MSRFQIKAITFPQDHPQYANQHLYVIFDTKTNENRLGVYVTEQAAKSMLNCVEKRYLS